MKEFTLNYIKRTKQENCYQDPISKTQNSIVFKKIKNVVELPYIWKKSNQCKSKNETKPQMTCNNDGNLYFSSSNQTINSYQKMPFTKKSSPNLGKADRWSNLKSIINNPIQVNINGSSQNLLDTGVVGGFEYWDGGFIELPN